MPSTSAVEALLRAGTDPYSVLGLSNAASQEQIKASYRLAVLRWHPDKHPPEKRVEAGARFASIGAAYEVLGDERLRREWDVASAPPTRGRTRRRSPNPKSPAHDTPTTDEDANKGRRGRGRRVALCVLTLILTSLFCHRALAGITSFETFAGASSPAPRRGDAGGNTSVVVMPPAEFDALSSPAPPPPDNATAAAAPVPPAPPPLKICEREVQYNTRRPGNRNMEEKARVAETAEGCSMTCAEARGCACFTWNGING
eukprot:Hpha_TRINITY_DN28413_c0_g1::TRINITY_DN28413_c0_g1_i1::g.183994::m.183994